MTNPASAPKRDSRRALRMAKHTNASLISIVKSGSLSHASAARELRFRKMGVPAVGSSSPYYDHANSYDTRRIYNNSAA